MAVLELLAAQAGAHEQLQQLQTSLTALRQLGKEPHACLCHVLTDDALWMAAATSSSHAVVVTTSQRPSPDQLRRIPPETVLVLLGPKSSESTSALASCGHAVETLASPQDPGAVHLLLLKLTAHRLRQALRATPPSPATGSATAPHLAVVAAPSPVTSPARRGPSSPFQQHAAQSPEISPAESDIDSAAAAAASRMARTRSNVPPGISSAKHGGLGPGSGSSAVQTHALLAASQPAAALQPLEQQSGLQPSWASTQPLLPLPSMVMPWNGMGAAPAVSPTTTWGSGSAASTTTTLLSTLTLTNTSLAALAAAPFMPPLQQQQQQQQHQHLDATSCPALWNAGSPAGFALWPHAATLCAISAPLAPAGSGGLAAGALLGPGGHARPLGLTNLVLPPLGPSPSAPSPLPQPPASALSGLGSACAALPGSHSDERIVSRVRSQLGAEAPGAPGVGGGPVLLPGSPSPASTRAASPSRRAAALHHQGRHSRSPSGHPELEDIAQAASVVLLGEEGGAPLSSAVSAGGLQPDDSIPRSASPLSRVSSAAALWALGDAGPKSCDSAALDGGAAGRAALSANSLPEVGSPTGRARSLKSALSLTPGSQRYRPRLKQQHAAGERALGDAPGGDASAASPAAAASRFGEEAVGARGAAQASSAALADQDDTSSPRSTLLLLRSGTAQQSRGPGRLGTPSATAVAPAVASLGADAPSMPEGPSTPAAGAACDGASVARPPTSAHQAASSLSIGAMGLTAAAPARARTRRGIVRSVSFVDEVTAQRMADEALGDRSQGQDEGDEGARPAATELSEATAAPATASDPPGEATQPASGQGPSGTAQVAAVHGTDNAAGERRRALRAAMRSHAIRITVEDWVR